MWVGVDELDPRPSAITARDHGVGERTPKGPCDCSNAAGDLSSTLMDVLSELLIYGIALLLCSPGIVYLYRRDRRVRELGRAENPAIEEALSMKAIRRDPERWLPKLRGKVTTVCTMSAPLVSDGGVQSNFHSFLIDVHGEAHDLEASSDFERIDSDARWLAEELDVPCEATA